MTESPDDDWGWLGAVLAVGLLLTLWHLVALGTGAVDLSFDEGQYWGWAQEPAWGYYSKPPMVAWAIWATTAVCGDGVACVKASSPLFHLGTGVIIFLIGRRLFAGAAGFWSAVVYWMMPGVALSSLVVSTDPPLLFFWSLALLAWVRLIQEEDRWGWLLLGLALGLGLLSKFAMLFFLLGILLHGVLCVEARRLWRRPGQWLALLPAGMFYLPNLYWNVQNGFVSYAHTRDNANLGPDLFHPERMAEFLGSQFAVFGPILFAILLWLFLRIRPLIREDRNWALLVSFTVPVLLLITVQALLSRAHANWAATAYVAATLLVTVWLLQKGGWPRRLVWISLALHLVIMGIGSHLDLIVARSGLEMPAKYDPQRRVKGWREVGEWVRQVASDHPDATLLMDERKTQASLVYHARPLGMMARRWNPGPAIVDHYALTRAMTGQEGGDFLLITRRPDAGHVAPSFASAEKLERITVRTHRDQELRLEAWLLRDFKGYAP